MQTIWTKYKFRILGFVPLSLAVGYALTTALWVQGDSAMTFEDAKQGALHWGWLPSLVVFVLLVVAAIPGIRIRASGDVPILDSIWEEQSDRASRNLAAWGTTNDLPSTTDDFF